MAQRSEPQKAKVGKARRERRPDADQRIIPKPESTSEYEGAATRQPTGNPGESVKTESTSEYEGDT